MKKKKKTLWNQKSERNVGGKHEHRTKMVKHISETL